MKLIHPLKYNSKTSEYEDFKEHIEKIFILMNYVKVLLVQNFSYVFS